jgi:hypothetical protein
MGGEGEGLALERVRMCGQRKHHLSEVTPRVENKRKGSSFAQHAKQSLNFSRNSQSFTIQIYLRNEHFLYKSPVLSKLLLQFLIFSR